MIPVSIDDLCTQYPDQASEIRDILESGLPTTIDLAESRGIGVYLFNEGQIWKFPESGGYLTIPLWWLYENNLLICINSIIMPAIEASGMFSIELQPDITLDPTEDGVTILQANAFVGSTNKCVVVEYPNVSTESLLAGNLKVMYGDHVCHVLHNSITLDQMPLTYFI